MGSLPESESSLRFEYSLFLNYETKNKKTLVRSDGEHHQSPPLLFLNVEFENYQLGDGLG